MNPSINRIVALLLVSSLLTNPLSATPLQAQHPISAATRFQEEALIARYVAGFAVPRYRRITILMLASLLAAQPIVAQSPGATLSETILAAAGVENFDFSDLDVDLRDTNALIEAYNKETNTKKRLALLYALSRIEQTEAQAFVRKNVPPNKPPPSDAIQQSLRTIATGTIGLAAALSTFNQALASLTSSLDPEFSNVQRLSADYLDVTRNIQARNMFSIDRNGRASANPEVVALMQTADRVLDELITNLRIVLNEDINRLDPWLATNGKIPFSQIERKIDEMISAQNTPEDRRLWAQIILKGPSWAANGIPDEAGRFTARNVPESKWRERQAAIEDAVIAALKEDDSAFDKWDGAAISWTDVLERLRKNNPDPVLIKKVEALINKQKRASNPLPSGMWNYMAFAGKHYARLGFLVLLAFVSVPMAFAQSLEAQREPEIVLESQVRVLSKIIVRISSTQNPTLSEAILAAAGVDSFDFTDLKIDLDNLPALITEFKKETPKTNRWWALLYALSRNPGAEAQEIARANAPVVDAPSPYEGQLRVLDNPAANREDRLEVMNTMIVTQAARDVFYPVLRKIAVRQDDEANLRSVAIQLLAYRGDPDFVRVLDEVWRQKPAGIVRQTIIEAMSLPAVPYDRLAAIWKNGDPSDKDSVNVAILSRIRNSDGRTEPFFTWLGGDVQQDLRERVFEGFRAFPNTVGMGPALLRHVVTAQNSAEFAAAILALIEIDPTFQKSKDGLPADILKRLESAKDAETSPSIKKKLERAYEILSAEMKRAGNDIPDKAARLFGQAA